MRGVMDRVGWRAGYAFGFWCSVLLGSIVFVLGGVAAAAEGDGWAALVLAGVLGLVLAVVGLAALRCNATFVSADAITLVRRGTATTITAETATVLFPSKPGLHWVQVRVADGTIETCNLLGEGYLLRSPVLRRLRKRLDDLGIDWVWADEVGSQ